jgi:hypothetical protein
LGPGARGGAVIASSPNFFCECIDQGDGFVVGRVSGEEQLVKRRIGSGSGGYGRASLGVVAGHLESQKENGCAASTDAAVGKTLKDAVEGVGDSVLVESCGYLDAMLR